MSENILHPRPTTIQVNSSDIVIMPPGTHSPVTYRNVKAKRIAYVTNQVRIRSFKLVLKKFTKLKIIILNLNSLR